MIVITDFEQRSEKWEKMRRGRPTASQFKRFITTEEGRLSQNKKKTDLSQGAMTYMHELIANSEVDESAWQWAGNATTDRGTDMEPAMRAAFEDHTGLKVTQVGFVLRNDEVVGCSPDGMIAGNDWEYFTGLEGKCPLAPQFVEIVASGGLPDDYKQQVHGSMAITKFREWHFFAFHPNFKPYHHVERWSEYTDNLSAGLDEFLIRYARARAELLPRLRLTEPAPN